MKFKKVDGHNSLAGIVLGFWRKLPSALRFSIGAYFTARVVLSFWSYVVFMIFPVALQNLDFFGEPVLAVFDLRTGQRYVFSRKLDDKILNFHARQEGYVSDEQTETLWSLQSGRAITGKYAGNSLLSLKNLQGEIYPYVGVMPEKSLFLSLWQRFDTNWYLAIAARGYFSEESTVYFPLYPLLVRLFGVLFPNPMLGALLVSNLSLIGVLALLFTLVRDIFDTAAAQRSVLYLLIFPTSFFLLSAYTESIFLLFTLASLSFAKRRLWFLAVILGALSALTRLQGVLLILPLGYILLQQVSDTNGRIPSIAERRLVGKAVFPGILLMLIPLATASFLAFSRLSLVNIYQSRLHAHFVFPWDNIFTSIALLVRGGGSVADALNLLVTGGLILMIYPIWKLLPFEYVLFSVLMLVAPLLRMTTTQPLVSMTRYALVVFPVFMVLGVWGSRPWVNRAIVYSSLLLQLYLVAQFVLWGWVA